MVVAVVPAAGKSERFGSQKVVADVGGETMLDRTIGSLLDGGVERVVVVLAGEGPTVPGSHGPRVVRSMVVRLADPRVTVVINPDPSRGMFSSIQTGVGAAAGDPILVLPADMPFVQSRTIASVIAECRQTGAVVTPRHAGTRGHPVAMPGTLRPVILEAAATSTLSDVLKGSAVSRVELDVADAGILRDVDHVADLGRAPGDF
jgi:molybdenum cofactor cytidylyltransferase